MALTFSASPVPNHGLVTVTGANLLIGVVVPAGPARVSFRARANDGKLVFGDPADGVVEGDEVGSTYVTLDADVPFEFRLAGKDDSLGTTTWWVTSATVGTEIEAVVEGGGR